MILGATSHGDRGFKPSVSAAAEIWEPEEDIFWGLRQWLRTRYSGDRQLAIRSALFRWPDLRDPEGPNQKPDPVDAARDIGRRSPAWR